MGRLISCGEYNKLYKFMWFSISFKLIFEYFFGTDFPEEIRIIKKDSFPKSILVQEILNYLGIFIFSIFLFIYEYKENKAETNEESSNSASEKVRLSNQSKKPSLIYENYDDISISYCHIIFAIALIIFADQLRNTFFIINLKGLDFKMFEILFVCIITLKMFKVLIYKHKKVAIGFILIFCISMKTISIIYRLIDDHKTRLFKIYTWIIPIGIISFILISFLRSYNFCKINWLFDLKFISVSQLLLFYGISGFLICCIISIFPNYISCVDKEKFNHIDYICNVTDFDISNNSTIYYYEKYSIYIKKLWRNERDTIINILYLVLIFSKIILNFLIKLFKFLIIKHLGPEYLICSNSIYYFFNESIDSIACLYLGKFKFYKLYDILDEFFSILGTMLYLELVEFDFCGIDFNLKKNIAKRSQSDCKLVTSFGGQSTDSNIS